MGTRCKTLTQFPHIFLTNSSKLRIYLCKIPTVITRSLMQMHHRCPPDEQTDIWCSYITVATTHHARFETKKISMVPITGA
jgi:hypothetical protein